MRKACMVFCILAVTASLTLTAFAENITDKITFYGGLYTEGQEDSYTVSTLNGTDGTLINASSGDTKLSVIMNIPSTIGVYDDTTLYFSFRFDGSGATSIHLASTGMEVPVPVGNIVSGRFEKNGSVTPDDYSWRYTDTSTNGCVVSVAMKTRSISRAYAIVNTLTASVTGMVLFRVYEPMVQYGNIDEQLLNSLHDLTTATISNGEKIDITNQKIDQLQQSINNMHEDEYNAVIDKSNGKFDVDLGISEDSFNGLPPITIMQSIRDIMTSTAENSVMVFPQFEIFGHKLNDPIQVDFSAYTTAYPIIEVLHKLLKIVMWLSAGVYVCNRVMSAISLITGEQGYQDASKQAMDDIRSI